MLLIRTMKQVRKMASLRSFRATASKCGAPGHGLDCALKAAAEGKLVAAKSRLKWLKEQWKDREHGQVRD